MRSATVQRTTKARPNIELRRAREARDLSQARLAILVGCGQGDIAKLETGAKRTTADWAARIAPHLGIDPQALFPAADQERVIMTTIAPTDPEKLRVATAIAREMAMLHGAQGREDVISGLTAAIYDALAELENSGQTISLDEALPVIEAILRRLWRPPPP